MSDWFVRSTKVLIDDQWMRLRADCCETEDGVVVDPYYVQESSDWISVVAFDDNENVLVVEQYRHAYGARVVELPAGCVDPGELPDAAARRELREEAGCTVRTLQPLAVLSPNPARMNNRLHPFVAFGAALTAVPSPDAAESLVCTFIPLRQLLESIKEGRFIDALHIANIFLALEQREGGAE